MTGTSDAEARPEPDRPRWLLTPLDPFAELLAGAFPYHGRPNDLPDGHAFPHLTIRHEPQAARPTDAGARVPRFRFVSRLGDEVRSDATFEVPRWPLDARRSPPRRRRHPAPVDALTVRSAPDGEPASTEPSAGDHPVMLLSAAGPGPGDHARVHAAAAEGRFVHLDEPLTGHPALLSSLVLQLVAAAIPVAASTAVTRRLHLLDPGLRDLLSETDPGALAADDLQLARAAADQRRAAWRAHDLTLAWPGPGPGSTSGPADATDAGGAGEPWAPRLVPPRRPHVAVVLTTRRPQLVGPALAMIAAQRDVDVEVAVVLHGGGPGGLERVVAEAPPGLAVRTAEVPAGVPFGAAIQHGIDQTTAPLVAKWDDDDLYGPDHLIDLVIAQRHSQAELVGRAPEFVLLQDERVCLWRTPGRAEAPSTGLAGGAMLTSREVLRTIGGLPPAPYAEDHHLKQRVLEGGGTVFRTHSFGFVLRRHGGGHTWQADDATLRARAVRSFDGVPAIVGLEDAVGFVDLPALSTGR